MENRMTIIDMVKIGYKELVLLGFFYLFEIMLCGMIISADESFLHGPFSAAIKFLFYDDILVSILIYTFIWIWGIIVSTGTIYLFASSQLINIKYRRLLDVFTALFILSVIFKLLPINYPSVNQIKLLDNHPIFNFVKQLAACFLDVLVIVTFLYTVLAIIQSILIYIFVDKKIGSDC